MSEEEREVKALPPTGGKAVKSDFGSSIKKKRPMDFKGTLAGLVESFNGPLGVMAILFGFAVAYFGAIEWRVNLMVQNPDFVAQVARRVRPAIVFDADRRLLSDSGAYRFLEGVPEVELNVKDETVKARFLTRSQELSFDQKCRLLARLSSRRWIRERFP